jgi:hypothetical protein
MPGINIAEDTFRRLAEKATALHATVAELVRPALDGLPETGPR